MHGITLQSHISPDGILTLKLPDALRDQEVTITIEPVSVKLDQGLGVANGWREGFFVQTAGTLADDASFVRHPQGVPESREDFE